MGRPGNLVGPFSCLGEFELPSMSPTAPSDEDAFADRDFCPVGRLRKYVGQPGSMDSNQPTRTSASRTDSPL